MYFTCIDIRVFWGRYHLPKNLADSQKTLELEPSPVRKLVFRGNAVRCHVARAKHNKTHRCCLCICMHKSLVQVSAAGHSLNPKATAQTVVVGSTRTYPEKPDQACKLLAQSGFAGNKEPMLQKEGARETSRTEKG